MELQSIFNDKLKGLKWFQQTDKSISKVIIDLDNEYNGYKKICGEIEDENLIYKVIKMIDLKLFGNFVWSKFELRNNATNQITDTDFLCWKNGDNPLNRGVVLVENDNKVLKVIVDKRFSTIGFRESVKSFSVASPEFQSGQLLKLPEKLSKSLGEYSIKRYYDLGRIELEDSVFASKTSIFAISVELENFNSIDNNKVKILDIEKLNDELGEIKDIYLLAILAKLKFQNII